MKFLLAAMALAAPAALTAPAAAAVAPAPASDLDGLVALMVPDQAIVDLVIASTGKGFDQEFGKDEFARYPGMRDYVLAQMRPELSRTVLAELPKLRADIAAILARELTPGEITELYSFFASPTGKKLYAVIFQSIGEDPGADEEAMRKQAMDRLMASLTPEDYGPLAAFGGSSGAAKMNRITPQITAATGAWTDKLMAEHGTRLAQVGAKAIEDYRRQHPAGGQ